MRKNMLEDIKPISRSSRSALTDTPREVHPSLPREVPYVPEKPKRTSRYGLWYVAAACIVGLLFSLSFLFEHAVVTITPKSLPLAFDASDTFTAQKDNTADGVIVYTVMRLSGDESVKLPSTGSKNESESARGQVILYNAYTASPYNLVKNTRLQSPDGRIYRLDGAVTIPGMKGTGSSAVPGSVTASVTAAVPGEGGNLENSDFSVPGLSGTPQATKIYARSKTPFTGGVSGVVYTVDQSAADAALSSLTDKLKGSLMQKAQVQVPDGYAFFPGATVFTTDAGAQASYSKDKEVPIALSGTLTSYLIKEDTLSRAIGNKYISQYAGEPITIPMLASLTLSPQSALAPDTDTAFTFSLSGSAKAVWAVDKEDIAKRLAGQKKKDLESILSAVSGVERAEVVIKPFWKFSFPKDSSRIQVNNKDVK